LKTVISIRDLSKQYLLGTRGTGTFVHDLNRWLVKQSGREDPYLKIGQSALQPNFWALKNINFELQEGDILGVIGKNGAGKSTLLKLLSKITLPTTGQIKIKGKLSSLLEVGTGFHPELTGRENIFLNGAILGMSKAEIKSKFDEIVDFSSIAEFIDTPVKRYSSGMYVRLAFAVAANLSAEIIIVDEVLAVGDAEFQKKCIGKMREVSNSGRTLIFVSHNMAAIKSLCTKGLVLTQGTMAGEIQTAQQAVSAYLNSLREQSKSIKILDSKSRKGNGKAMFTRIAFFQNSEEVAFPVTGESLTVRLYFNVYQMISQGFFAISFNSIEGENKILLSSELLNKSYQFDVGQHFVDCKISKNPLQAGEYSLNLFLKNNNDIVDWIQEAMIVEIAPGDYYGTGRIIENGNSSVFIQQNWN
jgi:lipopolysaccharide transport system ATP-binding protein